MDKFMGIIGLVGFLVVYGAAGTPYQNADSWEVLATAIVGLVMMALTVIWFKNHKK